MIPSRPIDFLLSVPGAIGACLADCEPRIAARVFATHDPESGHLGSGGGTAHLLQEAWKARGNGASFADWLDGSFKIVIHGGGESRRLPAYAATGKLFLPVPVCRSVIGQRLDQTLFDVQRPLLESFARRASPAARLMIASGDVLLRAAPELPALPEADVVIMGLATNPEAARNFGVMFCSRQAPERMAFFLQKPAPERIRELAAEHLFFIDTGVWVLSARAVAALLARCGWDPARGDFRDGLPQNYELYNRFGLHLGAAPCEPDPEISALSVAVCQPREGAFYHFGNNRDLIESAFALQNLANDESGWARRLGLPPRQAVQNSVFHGTMSRPGEHTLWVENSHIPATWTLAGEHVLTGVPENRWTLELEPGVCLDFVPVDDAAWAVRAYGIGDSFRGPVDHAGTRWLGRPALDWFAARGLDPAQAGFATDMDIQCAPLFPVLTHDALNPVFLRWLFAAAPADSVYWAGSWLSRPRLSARELTRRANLRRLYDQRRKLRQVILPAMAANPASTFYRLDLAATADLYAADGIPLPPPMEPSATPDPLLPVHDRMFRAAVRRRAGVADWEQPEQEAFALLRDTLVRATRAQAVRPECAVLEDQILWARAPVRLDLAGGWTDTPPYCLEHGGKVVNAAVNLNGQPPIQVFLRHTPRRELVIRSIDLGLEERLTTYAEVANHGQITSGFAIARAAFALAGFHPDFNGGAYDSLDAQLRDLGGGVEVSLLSAVPKGSGLGTSSILAATLLGALGEFGRLGWDRHALAHRTLVLEQLMTSGGGWQDQVGGLLEGIKLVETVPGLEQHAAVRWLPGRFFDPPHANDTLLLYYTGITRVAQNILREIVRGIFLNDVGVLDVLEAIGRNALFAHEVIQRQDGAGLAETVRRSWALNCRLDAGTNPPATQAILDALGDNLLAAKLLGAGGGGFFLFIARDPDASRRIRAILTERPPNPRARFVDFSLSGTGLQITRS